MKKLFFPIVFWLALFCHAAVPAVQAQGCNFEDRLYFEGQSVCQYGSLMKCSGGSWTQTGNPCSATDESERTGQPRAGNPGAAQAPEQPRVPQIPDVPPATR